jgi:hypothetical protein
MAVARTIDFFMVDLLFNPASTAGKVHFNRAKILIFSIKLLLNVLPACLFCGNLQHGTIFIAG